MRRSLLTRFLLIALLGGAGLYGGLRLGAAVAGPAVAPAAGRTLTLHRWGIGVRALPAPSGPRGAVVLRVADLGPDVAGIREDLRLDAAEVRVNGAPPLSFTRVSPRMLEATLPPPAFRSFGHNAADLRILAGGREIVSMDLAFLLQ